MKQLTKKWLLALCVLLCLTVGLMACSKTVELAAPVIELKGNVISWSAVENATGYKVYEGDQQISVVTGTSYTITKTDVGTYVYTVVATSSDEKKYTDSKKSNEVSYKVDPRPELKLTEDIDGTPVVLQVDMPAGKTIGIDLENKVSANKYYLDLTLIPTGAKITVNVGSQKYEFTSEDNSKLIEVAEGVKLFTLASDATEDINIGVALIAYVDPVALDKPTVTINRNELSWTAVENATGYIIYEDEVVVDTVTGTSYTIAKTEPGTYSYTVKATATSRRYSDSEASTAVQFIKNKELKATAESSENNPEYLELELAASKDVNLDFESGVNGCYKLVLNGDVPDGAKITVTLGSDEYYFTPSINMFLIYLSNETYGFTLKSDAGSALNIKLALIGPVTDNRAVLGTPVVANEGNVLRWAEVANAAGYAIYEDGKLIDTVTAPTYAITKIKWGTYSYQVQAIADYYSETYKSGVLSLAIEYEVKEATLTKPEATIEGNVVSWEKVENATHYMILRDGAKVDTVEALEYSIVNCEWGNTYDITVKAIIDDGENYKEGEASEAVSYTFGDSAIDATNDVLDVDAPVVLTMEDRFADIPVTLADSVELNKYYYVTVNIYAPTNLYPSFRIIGSTNQPTGDVWEEGVLYDIFYLGGTVEATSEIVITEHTILVRLDYYGDDMPEGGFVISIGIEESDREVPDLSGGGSGGETGDKVLGLGWDNQATDITIPANSTYTLNISEDVMTFTQYNLSFWYGEGTEINLYTSVWDVDPAYVLDFAQGFEVINGVWIWGELIFENNTDEDAFIYSVTLIAIEGGEVGGGDENELDVDTTLFLTIEASGSIQIPLSSNIDPYTYYTIEIQINMYVEEMPEEFGYEFDYSFLPDVIPYIDDLFCYSANIITMGSDYITIINKSNQELDIMVSLYTEGGSTGGSGYTFTLDEEVYIYIDGDTKLEWTGGFDGEYVVTISGPELGSLFDLDVTLQIVDWEGTVLETYTFVEVETNVYSVTIDIGWQADHLIISCMMSLECTFTITEA